MIYYNTITSKWTISASETEIRERAVIGNFFCCLICSALFYVLYLSTEFSINAFVLIAFAIAPFLIGTFIAIRYCIKAAITCTKGLMIEYDNVALTYICWEKQMSINYDSIRFVELIMNDNDYVLHIVHEQAKSLKIKMNYISTFDEAKYFHDYLNSHCSKSILGHNLTE
jgi:hypothetical protein